MKLRPLVLLAAAASAAATVACSRAPAPPPQQQRSMAAAQRHWTARKSPARAAPNSGPPERTAPQNASDSEAAAAVVRAYYDAIGRGDYRAAWRLREPASGLSFERFKDSFASYADYGATVGTPSEPGGAAGSLYVEVPVQIYGRTTRGKPFGSAGTVTLRRSNDVPGATSEQRHWRIYTGG